MCSQLQRKSEETWYWCNISVNILQKYHVRTKICDRAFPLCTRFYKNYLIRNLLPTYFESKLSYIVIQSVVTTLK